MGDQQQSRREILQPLAAYLSELWLAAGKPSLRHLRSQNRALSVSTMSEVLNAKTAPKLGFVLSLQEVCARVASAANLEVRTALTDPVVARQLWESQDIRLRLLRRFPMTARLVHTMPAAPNDFVGRELELSWLDQQLLSSDRGLNLAAIDGMPGVGKTALVSTWVATRPFAFSDGVYFVDLQGGSPAGALETAVALHRILVSMGKWSGQGHDPFALAAQFRSITASQNLCLILDNALDEAQVRPLLPNRGGCIITSRNRLSGLRVREGARLKSICPLPTAHGSRLLTQITDVPIADSAQVVDACGGLPLGIRLAAELISSGSASPAELVRAQQVNISESLDSATEDQESRLDFLFGPAYSARGTREQELLVLVAHSSCMTHGIEAIAALMNDPTVDPVVDVLIHANLLQHDATGRVTMHDLLRSWLRANHRPKDADAARMRLFSYYIAALSAMDRALLPARNLPPISGYKPPTTLPDASTYDEWLSWGNEEIDNLVSIVVDAVQTEDWETATTVPHIAMSLLNVAKPWPQWIAMYETAALAVGHVDCLAAANILNNLGIAYREVGRWQDAVEILDRADVSYAECGNRTGRAMALNNIGLCLRQLDQHDRSVEKLRQAFELITAEGDRFRLGIVALNLAEGELIAGQPTQALASASSSLAAANDVDDKVGIAMALTSIGEIHVALGKLRLAEHAFHQAAEMQRELSDRFALGTTEYRLARLLADCGRTEEALVHAEQARTLFADLGDGLKVRECAELVEEIRAG